MSNLAGRLIQSAEKFGERPAIRLEENILTYSDLDDRTRRTAGRLVDGGVKPGDRVRLIHEKAELAAYKYPRVIWLVDELPKGPTGRILRREVAPPAKDASDV